MSQAQRYERYRNWCRSIGLEPAAFDVWAKELAKIGEVSAVRGWGNNLVQAR